jgi:hypothetical protein
LSTGLVRSKKKKDINCNEDMTDFFLKYKKTKEILQHLVGPSFFTGQAGSLKK